VLVDQRVTVTMNQLPAIGFAPKYLSHAQRPSAFLCRSADPHSGTLDGHDHGQVGTNDGADDFLLKAPMRKLRCRPLQSRTYFLPSPLEAAESAEQGHVVVVRIQTL